jgi:ABC-2 type transport system permease protein
VSLLSLTARQVVFTNKAFWRNPASAFFTFAFPLMFLVIFTSLFGNNVLEFHPAGGGVVEVNQATFYVAAMAAFGVISACYTNIAISVAFARDGGILKRVRGAPLPGSAYLVGRVIHAMIVAFILVALCTAFGTLFYDASLPSGIDLVRTIVALLVGGATFCALGLACTTIIPNADASPAIVNATILPILFLSDVFIPVENAPAWVQWVGKIFPVKHFSEALQSAFIPQAVPWSWTNVLVIAAWGVAGLLVAARFFSWEPRR